MRRLQFVLLILMCTTVSLAQQKITTVIMVRHAEKGDDGTKDPDLTQEGYERASRLSKMLKETKVDAIYSTNYKRTTNTVQPLAKSKGLEVQQYEVGKKDAIREMLIKYQGGTVVICGHSNTIPAIANLLTGEEVYKDFDDTDYDNLLILSVYELGSQAKVIWLTY